MKARDPEAFETGLPHFLYAYTSHYTRGVIGAINLNCVLSLWNFQNSKYELTTDHKAV